MSTQQRTVGRKLGAAYLSLYLNRFKPPYLSPQVDTLKILPGTDD